MRITPTMLRVSTAIGLALAATGHIAMAQVAASSPAASTNPGGFEEVVVTARKVAQDVLKVPESISAISGKALEEQHIDNYQDISRTIPGIGFNAGSTVLGGTVGPGTSNIIIRGVSSASGSATVGLFIDDVSITESNLFDGAAEPKFLDFDRLEVLRGPQGTLFGASSMGGTLRMISRQPDLEEKSGQASTDLSDTSHGGVNYDEQVQLLLGGEVLAGSFWEPVTRADKPRA